jgi:histidine triad (HIT) family protein
MSDCLFCKIAQKEIPAAAVFEDDEIFCFNDISPQAPVHVLIIPKKHLDSLNDAAEEDIQMLGRILFKVKDLAVTLGLENGYRLVNNCGVDGMQSVQHLHFHLLGKRQLGWPPG